MTTVLELEAGSYPVAAAYRQAAAEGRPLNYGFATSWAVARMAVLAGVRPGGDIDDFMANIGRPEWQRPAPAAAVGAHRRDAGARPGRRRAGHRHPGRLRAEDRPLGVPGRRGAGRPRGAAHLHARPRAGRARRHHADRRRGGDRQGGRGDRRAHALLPRQQHLDPARRPRARAGRAGARRGRAGHHRGLPVRRGA
ncbi:hypothetical protein [Nonomuraea dietziae]|uniref:hypothetical protein n=1 Tax=Nonomuraea dietziae TaxID=65515 RepID=UPI0031DA76C9